MRHVLAHAQRSREGTLRKNEEAQGTTESRSAPARHILLVHDDPPIRSVVSELLSALGHRVSVAASAGEALQLGTPDIGILGDGRHAAGDIRR